MDELDQGMFLQRRDEHMFLIDLLACVTEGGRALHFERGTSVKGKGLCETPED